MTVTEFTPHLRHRISMAIQESGMSQVMGQALLDEPRPRLAPVHEYLNPPELTRREDAG